MTDTPHWTQDLSATYRQLAHIAVPGRAAQVAALLTLIPFNRDDQFKVLELASGEGRLSQAILHTFRNATLLALDYEQSMRDETANRLEMFNGRGLVDFFDMKSDDWYEHLIGVDVVVSSLCVHHLDGSQKRALFGAIAERISQQGALLIADLVLPKRAQSRALFAATWDAEAEQASHMHTGTDDAYKLFRSEQWNYYRHADDFDEPSPLADQLTWLREAGMRDVDCFWMNAGHAIYGGYGPSAGAGCVGYDAALAAAQHTLKNDTI